MFIGHYGIAYIVKKNASDIPLWLLFSSVQLLDIIAFILVLLGIEKATYTTSDNPFFRNFLDLPYSHSLSGALLVSCIVFIIFWAMDKKTWAGILGLCVLSHWVIDLIVHTPDLSIFFGSTKVGLGLWHHSILTCNQPSNHGYGTQPPSFGVASIPLTLKITSSDCFS